MNALVILLVPTPDGQPSTEQAGAVPALEVWQWRADQNKGKAGFLDSSSRQQTPPPFWTWFIENPRRCGA
jgi:hypothetical protein